MATLLIMDQSGDTRQDFNPEDHDELAWAEARFRELASEGYTAAVRKASGEAALVRSLDPAAEQILFYPRLVGG